MIPNYIWKTISGWINYSCTVTSHKMSENEMGYRGSKSVVRKGTTTVKEQRVDGSWHGLCVASPKTVFKGYSNGFRKKLSS
jgi:hypothetical protein